MDNLNYKDKDTQALLLSIATDVASYLNEYDLTIRPEDLVDNVDDIFALFIKSSGEDVATTLKKFKENRESVGQKIAEQMLILIAEERPGTNPYDHARNIPLPRSFACTISNTLSIMVHLSLINNRITDATNFARILNEYTDKVALYTITELMIGSVDVSPIGQEGVRLFSGPYILLPQPALAHVARFMSYFVNLIELKEISFMSNDLESEKELVESYLYNFGKQGATLSLLRQRFGDPVNPGQES